MVPAKKQFEKCPYCKGSKKCNACKGAGMIIKKGFFSTKETGCNVCEGLGFCIQCGGKGKYELGPDGKTVQIKCPKCSKIIPVLSKTRPITFKCPNCEMNLVLKT